MGEKVKPHILIVDDQADAERNTIALLDEQGHFTVLHPQDVESQDLQKADLVLVDYVIEEWPEREESKTISLQPQNGLALAAVLRSHAHTVPTSTAFALRSGHLPDLSKPFPPEPRLHVLAQAHNLEWVFPKKTEDRTVSIRDQIIKLALAVRQLPEKWPINDPEKLRTLVEKFLSIPDEAPWAGQAWQDIEDCHPPIHELVEKSHGLTFLRWLLHRILPYPCFLWDTYYLAARLRVRHASLYKALDSGLADTLKPFCYGGLLSGFLGQRWWRSGIEFFLWNLTDGDPFDPERIRTLLSEKVSIPLDPAESNQPVVCVDDNYQPLEDSCETDIAVRIQPDDWPPYAEQAWTTVELASRNPSLAALVVESDRERLTKNK